MINKYFNFYGNKQEQDLVGSLIDEVIRSYGFGAFYIPRDDSVIDDLMYGDSPLKKFERAYEIEAYLSNSMDTGMNQDFFSKFGLEIKNNVRVQMTKRAFEKHGPINAHNRPLEGDLLYIPWMSGTGELYEIKFVNDTKDSFALGRPRPYFWELELELFKYSNEKIDTGYDAIDLVDSYAYEIHINVADGSGDYMPNEIIYQANDASYMNAFVTATVKSWDSETNILSLNHINGTLMSNINIIGVNSNAYHILDTFDPLNAPYNKSASDNKVVENEVDNIIDLSEDNPFGTLGSGGSNNPITQEYVPQISPNEESDIDGGYY